MHRSLETNTCIIYAWKSLVVKNKMYLKYPLAILSKLLMIYRLLITYQMRMDIYYQAILHGNLSNIHAAMPHPQIFDPKL